jgi:type I restriction enzyme S subunit
MDARNGGAERMTSVAHREHDLKPYPAYKDSGVQWLGDVPEHWAVGKLRTLLNRVTERNRPDLPLLSVVREKGVIRRNMTSNDENYNFIPDDLSNYKVVRIGQFAMNKMKAWQGSYGISKYDGIVSPAYFVFDLRGIAGDFFHSAIRSKAYVPFFTQASDGVRIGQWDLAQTRMNEIPFFIPTLDEQAAIVRYLDYMDQRLRKYIRAKQKLIKLLEEQKQAIIHRAVTRGLDPNVRLKSPGVEWLGNIPEHWEVCTLRRKLRSYDGIKIGPFGSQLKLDQMSASGYKVYGQANVIAKDFTRGTKFVNQQKFDELSACEVQSGDLVVTMMGTSGRCARVPDKAVTGIMDSHLLRLRTDASIDVSFAALIIDGAPYVKEQILVAGKGSIMQGLNSGMVKDLVLVLPPLPEQTAIVQFLDKATSEIDIAKNRAQRVTSLLHEHRTRLIADVVTGKLDVREVAEQLPDEADEPEARDDIETQAEEEEIISGDSMQENIEL